MRRTRTDAADRAQSETIGTLLLAGVIIILIAIIGIVVLGGIDTRPDPLADLRIEANETHITITHEGGDEFPVEDLRVVLAGETDTQQYTIDPANVTGGDGQFGFGDVASRQHGLSGSSATVRVVHAPTNAVIAESAVSLESDTEPDYRPGVAFTISTRSPSVGESVTFDGTGSNDPGGRITTYAWDFDGDGTTDQTTSAASVSHTYASGGTYVATLTVTDDDGRTATASKTIDVTNTEPTASLEYEPKPPAQQEVTLDASGSNDDGTITSYEWTFDDGDTTTTTDPTVTHNYADGTYTPTVTVVDNTGSTSGASVTFTVDSTPPQVTDSSLTDDNGDGVVTTGDSVTVTATVSDATVGVDEVTVDASAFDAGTITLTDGDGNGVYETTYTVGSTPREGAQSVTIDAVDTYENTKRQTTGDSLLIDTTAPQVTFTVSDQSFFFLFIWVDQYQIDWSVSDSQLDSTTVYVNQGGTTQYQYSGGSGSETYSDVTRTVGRQYTIEIIAVDTAGNRECRRVVDRAEGDGPDQSQYESC